MSSSESINDNESNKRRKKGKQSEYQFEKIKKARVKNKEYFNYKGKVVKQKEHGFHFNCKWKCIPTKVTDDTTTDIYTRFIDFTSKNEQDAYLQSLIECKPIERERRKIHDGNLKGKPKTHSFKYSVSTTHGRTEICKTAFLSIHGITPDRVRRLCGLLSKGQIPLDFRGKNLSGNAKPGRVVEDIRNHIASFPQKEAHYTTRTYHYLSANLNGKIMWQLFNQQFPDLGVNYQYYLSHLNESGLSFGRPQVDTCCKCEELKVKIKSPSLSDASKRVYVAELLVHKRRAAKFYAALKSVKEKCLNDNTVAGICMDYMQNLQLPEIPVQETFYLRQLTLNVFIVHNISDEKAMFYLYHEGIAKKGPNEVSSFLVDYVNNVLSKDVKHLHLFSDGTGGQNKNNTVVRLLLALVEHGRFETIHHYFPIRGHSFLPCDRDFSVVKRKIKKIDRIYTVKEYTELLLHSSKILDKFLVKLVSSSDVNDYKAWWPHLYKRNTISTESLRRSIPRDEKQKFNMSTFLEFIYSKEHLGQVVAKSFIGGLNQHTFNLKKNTVPPLLPTTLAVKEKVPINKKKLMT